MGEADCIRGGTRGEEGGSLVKRASTILQKVRCVRGGKF